MKVAERMHGLPRIGLDIMGDLADELDMSQSNNQAFRLKMPTATYHPQRLPLKRAVRQLVKTNITAGCP